tara:strand:+ start:609 stop:956 length:348 start_codon:yes stop_codon:yes gene_type:complete
LKYFEVSFFSSGVPAEVELPHDRNLFSRLEKKRSARRERLIQRLDVYGIGVLTKPIFGKTSKCGIFEVSGVRLSDRNLKFAELVFDLKDTFTKYSSAACIKERREQRTDIDVGNH